MKPETVEPITPPPADGKKIIVGTPSDSPPPHVIEYTEHERRERAAASKG